MFNIPIFLTTYKRLDNLDNLFKIIEKLNPEWLFITSDGPAHERDKPFVHEVRKKIDELRIDGKLIKLYSDINLGIHNNFYININYAFELVDKLIFIEDDVEPSLSFFYFCRTILNLFEHDNAIKMINGSNFSTYEQSFKNSYIFTKIINSSSNAIWKRSFNEIMAIKKNLEKTLEDFDLNSIQNLNFRRFVSRRISSQLRQKEYVSVELLWILLLYKSNNYNVVHKKNLVKLGGVDKFGSNTLDDFKYLPKEIRRLYFFPANEISISNIKHEIFYSIEYDNEIIKLLAHGNDITTFIRKTRVLGALLLDGRIDVIIQRFKLLINKILHGGISNNN